MKNALSAQLLLGDGLQNSRTWIQFPVRAQVTLCATSWGPTLGPLSSHIQSVLGVLVRG